MKKLQKLDNLEDCLKQFESIKYKASGYNMVFLDYNYRDKTWSMTFRSPVNFHNPDTNSKTPIKACHKMIDFLTTLKVNK